jgi:hypothetical protein
MFSMLLLLSFTGYAQYDDLYYDPADDTDYTTYVYEEAPVAESRPYAETLPSYSEDYDDYSYWDEQDYVYSSRIRRFHQPYGNFGYYDPIYTDMGFYDPWMMPGSSIYIVSNGFNDYRQWRRMNRFRTFGSFGFYNSFSPWAYRGFMDPWSFNSWGAYRVYDPWFDPYWGGACFNPGFGPGWGGGFGNTYVFNNFYGGGGFYNNPGYWYGNPNGTIDSSPSNTHYGPRTTGARTAPARTASTTEFRGSGIPTIRQVEGTNRPVNPSGVNQEEGKSIRNGQVPIERGKDLNNVTTPERPTTQPERNVTRPTAPVRDQDNTTPTPNPRDEMKSNAPKGTVSPATPDRKDPLGDRPRWNDTDSNPPRQQTAPQTEMNRDAYRDNYIRNRQSESQKRVSPPSRERTTPRQDQRIPSNDRFNTPNRSNPSPERTAPSRTRTNPSDDKRSYPSRERTSPDSGRGFRSTGPSRGDSSPSYSPPSRSSSPSGGSTRSSNSSSRSTSPSRGGRGE